MAILPNGLVNQTQLADEVSKAVGKLGNDVVHVYHNIGSNTSGDPSIFFRIVLTDAASREDNLADVIGRIENVLFEEIRPYEWGLIPYFSFRSESEQATLGEHAWK